MSFHERHQSRGSSGIIGAQQTWGHLSSGTAIDGGGARDGGSGWSQVPGDDSEGSQPNGCTTPWPQERVEQAIKRGLVKLGGEMEVRSGAVTCVSLSDPQSHCGGWRNQNFRASQVSCMDNSTLLHLFKLLHSRSFIFSWERSYLTHKASQHLVFFSYQNFHGTDHLFSCSFLVPKIWH